jgi:hypothetical protein
MALKKSDLYSSLWASCDELRGGMDASQYKDYVLVLLFIKYISDKYSGQPYAPITVPKGSSFTDLAALKGTCLPQMMLLGVMALKSTVILTAFANPPVLSTSMKLMESLSTATTCICNFIDLCMYVFETAGNAG